MSTFIFLVCLAAATVLLVAFAADELLHLRRGLADCGRLSRGMRWLS